MKNKPSARRIRVALGASLGSLTLLAACGGGGGTGSASTSAAAAATSMSGTVAIGNALTSASVTVTDANGKTATATSGATGAYSVSISGLTAPFVITATDPSGASGNLYSVIANAMMSNGAPVIANVTPLTTAVAALITADGNPLTLTQSGAASSVTSSAVSAAIAKLDTALSAILAANGLSASSFDPIGGSFTPNQTGADAVIDSVKVTPSTMGSGLQLASLADPNTAIQLNKDTAVSASLRAPSQPANYLASLLTELGQCMGGTPSACSSALDTGYLNDSYSSMQTRYSTLFAAGSTLTGAKTIAFLPAGTLPAVGNPAALVYFLFTDANGKPNFASDVVQQLPNGAWDVIGNQEQYNLNIASFLGRVQFTDAADANNDRLESGLEIQIPSYITVNGTSTYVASALVQGAGLPSSGLYMVDAGAGLGPYLMLPLQTVTAPAVPVSCTVAPCPLSWPSVGISTQYKWSWASLSGGTSSWSPNGAIDYTAQSIDVSTVPQQSVYTVTLYDISGNQIGQPQKVINVGQNAAAAAGLSVAWQTLGNDVITNLLAPGGSGTSATGDMTTTLDWTVPANSPAYPNFWASINSQEAEAFSNGVATYQAQAYDVNNYATPTLNGLTYSEAFTGFVDVLTATVSSPAEAAVQVQLNWNSDSEYFSNTWQYNN